MNLTQFIEELQELESLWLWDAKIILSPLTPQAVIHREYDQSMVSEDWKFIHLSDFQREWKTRNYWKVVLWED